MFLLLLTRPYLITTHARRPINLARDAHFIPPTEIERLQKMELEIREQSHEMWAEGTSDVRPKVDDIVDEIAKRGYAALKVDIVHDDMQGFWRFTADIGRANYCVKPDQFPECAEQLLERNPTTPEATCIRDHLWLIKNTRERTCPLCGESLRP